MVIRKPLGTDIKRRMQSRSYEMDTACETDEIDSTHVTAGAHFEI